MLDITDRALVVDPVLCAAYHAQASRLDAARLLRAVEIARLSGDRSHSGRTFRAAALAFLHLIR